MKVFTACNTFTLRAQEERKKKQAERKRKKQESFSRRQARNSESDALAAYNKNKKIWDEAHPDEKGGGPTIPTVFAAPPTAPEPETKGSSMSVALSSCLSLSKSGLDSASKCARGAKVTTRDHPSVSHKPHTSMGQFISDVGATIWLVPPRHIPGGAHSMSVAD